MTDWVELESQLAAGRDAEATMGYAKALAGNPDSGLARLRLGQCHVRAGRLGEAERVLLELSALLDARPDALRQEAAKCLQGRDLAELLPHGQAPAVAQVRLLLGEVLEKQGKIPEAVASAVAALEHEPRFGAAYRLLSHLAWRNRDFDPAMELARSAVLIEPERPTHLGPLCSYLADHNRIDEGILACELVLVAAGETSEVHNELGKLYLVKARRGSLRHGLLAKAFAHLRRSLELEPQQADIRALLATVAQFMDRRPPPADPAVGRSLIRRVPAEIIGSGSGAETRALAVAPAAEPSDRDGRRDDRNTGPNQAAAVRVFHGPRRRSRVSRANWSTVQPPEELAAAGKAGAISEMSS